MTTKFGEQVESEIEDLLDLEDALEALEEANHERTISWEELKKELGI